MARLATIWCVLAMLAVLAQANLVTYYEDNFDGDALGPAWTVLGTGAYTVAGGTLSFHTQSGDFHPAYEATYGVPHHVFLIDPPSEANQWSAVARVRFNTPDQAYEQVDLMAFTDHNNNVRLAYDATSAGSRWHVVLSEQAGVASQTDSTTAAHSDYFWMRLDRNGTEYTGWVSNNTTTNPDLVEWTSMGRISNRLVDPMVGIGGWNTFTSPSGELAEFDYFRLQVVPEPAACVAGLVMLLVSRRTRRRA